MGTYSAHIFKKRQVGGREEVKVKFFDVDGSSLDFLSENPDDPATISEHINSETPHPVYDDGPSLTLLYANAKV